MGQHDGLHAGATDLVDCGCPAGGTETGAESGLARRGLAEAGVQLDKRGYVTVDKHFATNVPGIDAISGRVVTYPVSIRVAINQKDVILRELRLRILQAFEQNDIPLGTDPANMLLMHHDPSKPALPLQMQQ